jgi:glutathione S-transferase
MAIQLYSWPRSSGTRICWALEELGVPYQYVELDPKKKEHLAPAFLAINPHGKVPALVDGDQRFFESVAILLHLAHKYAVDKGLWPAAGSPLRADALSWLVWSGTGLGPHLMEFIYHGIDSPVSYAAADRSTAAAQYNRSQLDRLLGALEARLNDREYLLGDQFSLADLACTSALAFGTMCGVPYGDHPRTTDWVRRCTARPARARAR